MLEPGTGQPVMKSPVMEERKGKNGGEMETQGIDAGSFLRM